MALFSLLALALTGCALNSKLASVRHKMAAHEYGSVHQDLASLWKQRNTLSPDERREVGDDLCLTEFTVGEPAYPVAKQYAACSKALAAPGSGSRPVMARIEDTLRDRKADEVESALRDGNIARAQEAALAYYAIPGGDPGMITRWRERIWAMLGAPVRYSGRGTLRRQARNRNIGKLAAKYARLRKLNERAFERWVERSATVGGSPLVAKIAARDHNLDLWVAKEDLPAIGLNLDRFVEINDALVARCGCAARTNIGVAETGFPAYQVRLQRVAPRSEVLILPHS